MRRAAIAAAAGWRVRHLTRTITNRPAQPMRYHCGHTDDLASWAQPGALVMAGYLDRGDLGPAVPGTYPGTNPGYIAAAEAGATVLGYIDPMIDASYGIYHELLINASDSLGRSVGPAAALWPGPLSANEYGNLIDFRVGSVIQDKFGPVLEQMLADCPWLGGFWLDDVGARSYYPNFDWAADMTATERQDYRDGAIALCQTARQVCDDNPIGGQARMFLVNGTWQGGTLLDYGGGYPDPDITGMSLAEGGEIENHARDSFWTAYAQGPQWATESSTNGVPIMVSSHSTAAERDDFTGAGLVAFSESDDGETIWGAFHETGLPNAR